LEYFAQYTLIAITKRLKTEDKTSKLLVTFAKIATIEVLLTYLDADLIPRSHVFFLAKP